MQFEHIKKRIILDLIDEIVVMGASELELVGHAVIELIEGQSLIHHGLNPSYRPVGYTVDTFSQDGSVVGECSAEKDYFKNSAKKDDSPKFDKIEKDIDHALSHGEPKKIYLIASQEEPESFRAKFLSTPHGKLHAGLIDILDARELAKHIYEFSIKNAEQAAFFADFFPDFNLNLQSYEYYGKVPRLCEAYQAEDAITAVVSDHFAAGNSICVLYGLSGSGKTQAAIDFVHKEMGGFEDYIWISGEDWKKDTPLSSVQRARGGVPFNVAGAFNSRKTLLIIDSLERTIEYSMFAGLHVGFALGARVLITSQLNLPGSELYVAVPRLSVETAAKILGENPENLGGLAFRFIEACRFSPLILATVRHIAGLGDISKDELYGEILGKPAILSQGDGTLIMKMLLKRLEPNSLAALVKIADSGSAAHDSRFLAHFIGQIERVNLQRLSILQSGATPGVLRVHDLICEAVKEEPGPSAIAEAVETYVSKLGGEMVPSILREIYLCSDQLRIVDESRGGRKPDWLLYSLLQVHRQIHPLWANLHMHEIDAKSSLAELLCIVDAKEAYAYTIESDSARREYYESCVVMYQHVLSAEIEDEMRAELLHHTGKALRRCGKLEEAVNCFSKVLELRPNWHATYGQIAHVGTQREASGSLKVAGEQAIRWLIERMLADVLSVPLRVSLAAIARLRSYRGVCDELSADPKKVQRLAEVIAMSALEGLDQFYEAFLSFTSLFGYHHSVVCVDMAAAQPEIISVPPSAVDSKQWVSICEALTNTATAAGRLNRHDLEGRINISAATFAAELNSCEMVKPYVARVIAKAYISAGKPQLALNRIEKTDPDGSDHWLLYQKSRAQLELEMHEASLRTAECALESAQQDPKGVDRLAIYFDQLSKCAEALNDLSLARSYSEQAIAQCKDDQYLRDLTSRHQMLGAGMRLADA